MTRRNLVPAVIAATFPTLEQEKEKRLRCTCGAPAKLVMYGLNIGTITPYVLSIPEVDGIVIRPANEEEPKPKFEHIRVPSPYRNGVCYARCLPVCKNVECGWVAAHSVTWYFRNQVLQPGWLAAGNVPSLGVLTPIEDSTVCYAKAREKFWRAYDSK